eukprot:1536078-Rhodomonas_salina.3
MCGTEIGYAAMQRAVLRPGMLLLGCTFAFGSTNMVSPAISLRSCYAMSGIEIAYDAMYHARRLLRDVRY